MDSNTTLTPLPSSSPPHVHGGPKKEKAESPLLAAILTAICAVSGLTAFFISLNPGLKWLSPYLYAVSYVTGGWTPILEVFEAMMEKRLDVNLLMVLAAIGAAVIGDYGEGATLLFLFSLSGALEKYTLERTARSISALIELRPDTTLVIRNGIETRVAIDQIQIGERVRVLPGERLAVDGVVVEGHSSIDQSTITGESMPVEKNTGDTVFAGTQNQRGSVIVEVTRRSDETKLAQIVNIVRDAQDAKGHTDTFIQRWQAPYVIGVLLASATTLCFHYFYLPAPTDGQTHWGNALYHAMVLLVAASPCAVVIATPAATLAGITRAAKCGVLFKAGAHLERLADITVLAIDKTGTITEGRPGVVSIWSHNGTDEKRILELTASVEQHSEHLFAQAVLQEAKSRGITVPPSDSFESHTGLGVHAMIDGHWTGIGKLVLFQSHAITVPEAALKKVAEVYALGQTALLLGDDKGEFGVIAVADKPRPEAASVLKQCRDFGIKHIVILTGDHSGVADAVAKLVGADQVRAGLLPEEKVTQIARIEREFGPVAMIGDGVNDAPALAAADIGIAMGGAGTDVALDTADIVLMKNDLQSLVSALWIAHRTRAAIKRGLLFAFAVISLLVLSSLFNILPLWVAVIGHEGSTVCTVFSGLFLLIEKLPGEKSKS
ncbi:MAG: heavy metal translocating P-type ATPase [Planctomycetota bacterium]